jgi:nucleoid DNA-binding protein
MAAKAMTKSELTRTLHEKTNIAKKEVVNLLEALDNLIKEQLGKKGPGIFTLHGLVKLRTVSKPATPERMGRNPATGEMIKIKAKPARKVVKASPLKALKDSVLGAK